MSIDAMKQALDALEDAQRHNYALKHKETDELITVLRAAIEQAQDPVAWVGPSWLNPETRTWESESFAPGPINGWIPLYTASRQWQGLTDKEIAEIAATPAAIPGSYVFSFARAIEAKLKERNT